MCNSPLHQSDYQQQSTKMSALASLPPELLRMIFEQLNLKDLARVRQVSKQFRAICEIVRVRELLIFDNIDESATNANCCWFYTNHPLKLDDAIRFDAFFRQLQPFHSDPLHLQATLKRLHFGHDSDGEYLDFDFRLLDLFVALEHLEIQRPILGCQTLSAPNLRTLSVCSLESWIYFGLHVACPKLETLRAEDLQIVHVELKASVRHLEITCYEELEPISEFPALECLVIDYPTIDLSGEEDSLNVDLRNLDSLKELKLCVGQCSYDENYEEFSRALKAIFRQRNALKRNDQLKIYLDDVELNADDFDRFITVLKQSPFAPFRYFKPFA